MTQTYFPGRVFVQEDMADERQHRKQIARSLNTAMSGKTNNTLQVTLDVSVASTTVTDVRISLSTAVLLSAGTEDAAMEVASGNLYCVPSQGQCVIHHTNSAVADRTFNVALIG